MNAVDVTAKKDNLRLTLSSNMSLSLTTTWEATCGADARLKLVKVDFKEAVNPKHLRRGFIQFTKSVFAIEIKFRIH